MKKITEDLEITSIDVDRKSKLSLKRAIVSFRFLNQFSATAFYYENSTGYNWFETDDLSSKVHESFVAEVEDNEEAITTWINEQIKIQLP